jgi:Flp pilus assembly protein TadG
MNLHEPHRRTVHLGCCANQHGVVLVFVAFLLIVLLGIAALAVDIGYVAITRNQLQNAADAAALAGAGKLGSIYDAQILPASLNSTEAGEVATAALTVGQENKAAGQTPNIESSDIVIGYWDPKINTFFNAPPSFMIQNAVRVTARPSAADGIPLGSITTFFANIFNISNVAVSATATASLTSPCDVIPGTLSPFVISQDSPYCNANPDIVFTANDPLVPPCAGWQTLDVTASENNMADFLNTLLSQNGCLLKGYAECKKNSSTNFGIPGKEVDETTHVMNGLTTEIWECLQNLYKCVRIDNKWEVLVPVVQRPCGQINQVPKIVSFATVTIRGVTIGNGSNIKVEGEACGNSPCIKASVVCNKVITEKGGGCAFYGTYGSVPGLVDKSPAP